MIDLHSHILPGIDDGPADMEGAVALVRMLAASCQPTTMREYASRTNAKNTSPSQHLR